LLSSLVTRHTHIALSPSFLDIHTFARYHKIPPSLPPPPTLSIDWIAVGQAHALAEVAGIIVPQLSVESSDAPHIFLGEGEIKDVDIVLQRGKEMGRE